MMNHIKQSVAKTTLAVAAFFLLTGYSSCDPIITNNGFDLWCGDQLCDWDMESGSIKRVATWHEADRGIQMGTGDVAFSQFSDINYSHTRCIRFDIIANIEGAASVTLEADYFDDGIIDFERSIPGTNWEPSSYLLALPPNYWGIRFRLRKEGAEVAVIAQLQAEESDECIDLPTDPVQAPLGVPCGGSLECSSGVCSDLYFGICSECDREAVETDDHYCESCSSVEPANPALEPYYGCSQ